MSSTIALARLPENEDYSPLFNFTPFLVVKSPETGGSATIKLALDKENTRRELNTSDARMTWWKTDGFMLLGGKQEHASDWSPIKRSSTNPQMLLWNIALVREDTPPFSFFENPIYVFKEFQVFPNQCATQHTPTHSIIDRVDIQFTGSELHKNPTMVRLNTRKKPRVTLEKRENSKNYVTVEFSS